MNKPNWINTNYINARKAKEIYPIVDGFKKLFDVRDYEKIDRILAAIDLSKLSPTAMVTFVATTFPARHKLNNWHSTVEMIRVELINQELDAKQILKGLINE